MDIMDKKIVQLTGMITHRFSLNDIVNAFQAADDPQSSLKVMVHE